MSKKSKKRKRVSSEEVSSVGSIPQEELNDTQTGGQLKRVLSDYKFWLASIPIILSFVYFIMTDGLVYINHWNNDDFTITPYLVPSIMYPNGSLKINFVLHNQYFEGHYTLMNIKVENEQEKFSLKCDFVTPGGDNSCNERFNYPRQYLPEKKQIFFTFELNGNDASIGDNKICIEIQSLTDIKNSAFECIDFTVIASDYE